MRMKKVLFVCLLLIFIVVGKGHTIDDGVDGGGDGGLVYDYYEASCPEAETIIRSTIQEIFFKDQSAPPQLLRMLFHDCFIQGCDASLLLEANNEDDNQSEVERQAIPNHTLKGFEHINHIKEALERACPGQVSCADLLVLATRDAIDVAGGPFYPVSTGRRDSSRSFFETALHEIPPPEANINEILRLFGLRGFSAREIVALLGAHNIGKIGCEFIQPRVSNFKGTGQPDESMMPGFLMEMNSTCEHKKLVQSGSSLDSHYYESLIGGRGLLFADQQLLSREETARAVMDYVSDATAFWRDFAQAMIKLSNLGPLTGSRGQIRLNCSIPITTKEKSLTR